MKTSRRMKLFSLTLAVITLTGCGNSGMASMPPMDMGGNDNSNVLLVEASTPTYGTMELTGEFVATISPNQSVKVLAKTSGEVKNVNVAVGDTVEAGTVLCNLDDTDAQRKLESAQISYESALSNYNYSYGEAAEKINAINTDSTVQSATDNVQDNQQKLVDLRTNLEETQSKLNEELDKMKQLHADYDYDDIDELKDTKDYYFEKYEYYKSHNGDQDDKTKEYNDKYTAAYTRYSLVNGEDEKIQDKIDTYEDQVEDLQKQIDSYTKKVYETYGDFEDTITKQELQNGELRENQKNVSNNSVKAAKLNVESATDTVNYCTITAPVSGVVETVNVDTYDMLNTGTTAFVITSQDTMKACFYVSDEVRNTLELGQDVVISSNGVDYNGTITEIPNAVDDVTGLFEIETTVQADGNVLLSGTNAKLFTRTYHEDNTLIIPGDVINYQNSKGYVYCYQDGKAVKTYIETGLADDTNVEITEGITADSQIITSWSANLRDGVAVKIKGQEDSGVNIPETMETETQAPDQKPEDAPKMPKTEE